MGVHVGPEVEDAATALAEWVAERAARAGSDGFVLGLSGGDTPRPLFRLLASPAWRRRVAWSAARLVLADERALPRDDPGRNDRLVRELLVEPLGLDPAQLLPMRAEDPDLEAAARDYEAVLASPCDLLLLGMGADGHTASLFPGSPLVRERERRVAVVTDSPKPPPRRLTVTPRVLAESRSVAVLVTGAGKAAAVRAVLEGDAPPETHPAALVRGADWFLDRGAAGALSLS